MSDAPAQHPWQRFLERFTGAPWRDAVCWLLIVAGVVPGVIGDAVIGFPHLHLWLLIAFVGSRLWFLEKRHRVLLEEHELAAAHRRRLIGLIDDVIADKVAKGEVERGH